MEESLAAFSALRMKIAGATLVDMNKTLIYDDVGIAIMQYALELCGAHFEMEVHKINASSSVNFISTLLDTLPIHDMLDWNGSGKGFVQKPDAVFQISFATGDGTRQSLLVYYESDAGSKANDKDRKQAARKLYQSTCGCRAINHVLPAISVRANVFVGPEPDIHLAGSAAAELNKVQRSAQNALDFLHALTVAHLWFCCQVCLLVRQKGSFAKLEFSGDGRPQKKYDIHCLIGMIQVVDCPSLTFFEAPHVMANVHSVLYNVAGAAGIKCLFVERFDPTVISDAVRTCMTTHAAHPQSLHGMPTVQDMWRILQSCDEQALLQQAAAPPAPAAAPAAAPAVAAAGAAIPPATRLTWSTSGMLVVGSPGPGLANLRANARQVAVTAQFQQRLEAPNPIGSPGDADWNLGKNLVAEYYDAMCAVLHDAFFHAMTWIPVQTPHHNYLLDLKKLKAESKRDVSVLQSRAQSTGLLALGMHNSLGFTQKSSSANLNNMCMESLFESLPVIDPVLETYIATFHAPNIALFLRLIRCTNLLAFEHLAKTNRGVDLKDAFQKRLRHFPVGTSADLDYIMQYTISNAKNVHSIYLKPSKTSVLQSANVTHSTEYAWMYDLLNSISQAPSNDLDSMLPKSPLLRKFLLCHKTVYKMFHSIVILAPANNNPHPAVITDADKRAVFQRIIRALMRKTVMYFIDVVDRHVEIDCLLRRDEHRNDNVDYDEIRNLRGLRADGVTEESDRDLRNRLLHSQIKFTRLTWPLRDLNLFTRISLPQVKETPSGKTVTYPGNRSFCHTGDMHEEEKQCFDFMEALQERDAKNREMMEIAFDTDTVAHPCPTTAVPQHMQTQYSALLEKQRAGISGLPSTVYQRRLLRNCAASNSHMILMACRWKILLMKTTLLSALNGICQELSDIGTTPHQIASYSPSGPESSRANELILHLFKFDDPPPIMNCLYKPLPQYVVCIREFIQQTKPTRLITASVLPTIPFGVGGNAFDTNDVNLLECMFGIRHSGTPNISKLVWRSGLLVASRKYNVAKRRVELHLIDATRQNRCITESGAVAAAPRRIIVDPGWYHFL